MKRVALLGVLALAGAILGGCAHRGRIAVLSAEGVYDEAAASTSVHLRSTVDFAAFSRDPRPATAAIYICGARDRYWTPGTLLETSQAGVYVAEFRPIAKRTVWDPSGLIVLGWPVDLARRNGVCLRVDAAEMLRLTLKTNEVVLPR